MESPPPSAAPLADACRDEYPPRYLCDLAVQLLAAVSTHPPFTPAQVWASPNRTRHPSPSQDSHCCLVKALPRAAASSSSAMPFYFGRDADGYTMVTPRDEALLRLWPQAGSGRPKPIRLVRWIMAADATQVVRHDCDTPACVATRHLRTGTQGENLGDALKRRRRAKPAPRHARAADVAPAASPAHASSASVLRRKVVYDARTFVSPSKAARKAAKAARSAAD